MDVEDLRHHQQTCVFRQVFCPDPCESHQIQVLFKDFSDHLSNTHGYKFEWKMLDGQVNRWNICFVIDGAKNYNYTGWQRTEMSSIKLQTLLMVPSNHGSICLDPSRRQRTFHILIHWKTSTKRHLHAV